jgi:hypothetical protein
MDIKVSKMSEGEITQKLKDISTNLSMLFKDQDKTHKIIIALREAESKLKCERDDRKIKKFCKNPKNFTKDQWEFILEAGDHISKSQHEYSNKIMYELGFSAIGYHQETNQKFLVIYEYNVSKVIRNFELFKNYLKPITAEDIILGKEFGIRMGVPGLSDAEVSVIYIKKNEKVVFYKSRHDQKKQFKSFEEFIEWLTGQYQQKAESCYT